MEVTQSPPGDSLVTGDAVSAGRHGKGCLLLHSERASGKWSLDQNTKFLLVKKFIFLPRMKIRALKCKQSANSSIGLQLLLIISSVLETVS